MLLRRLSPVLVAVLVAGLLSASAASSAAAAADPTVAAALPPGGSFVPVTPTRVLDTRLTGGVTRFVDVDPDTALPGTATSSIAAVLFNVTVVDAVAPGWVALGGVGGAFNGTSNGNFIASAASATLAMVPYHGDPVEIGLSVPTDVVVDVQGYVTTPSAATDASFTPLDTARRIVDTRDRTGLPTFEAGQTQSVAAAEAAGLPRAATAIVANLTVANATAPTYVTGWSGTGDRPTVSSVNARAGDIVANRALLPLDADGRISMFNFAGRTDLVVDVVGYLSPDPAGSYYTPVESSRLFDQRAQVASLHPTDDSDNQDLILRAPAVRDLAPTTAVWLTVVGDQPAGAGFATVRPAGTAPTATSDVNLVRFRAVANAGPVRVSDDDGDLEVTASTDTRLVVDLSGWFRRAPAADAHGGLWTSNQSSRFAALHRADTVAGGPRQAFVQGVFTGEWYPGGYTFGYALTPERTVIRSLFEQLGFDRGNWLYPYDIENLTDVRSLATAGVHSDAAVYAVTGGGALYGFGSNGDGELGSPPAANPEPGWPDAVAVRVPLPQGAVATAAFAAPGVGYGLLADGTVMSWGRADTSQLGRDATSSPWIPAPVTFPTGSPVVIAGDASATFGIDAAGRTVWWGSALSTDGGSMQTVQAEPALFANGCQFAASLYADVDGVWERCTDGTVVQLTAAGQLFATRQTLPIRGVTMIGPGLGSGSGIRALLVDGRVADVTTTSARYEAGFAHVSAITGTRQVQLTLVAS